jgi:predicted transcriptional regulator
MTNRGWQDILANLLEITKQPTRKTIIMFDAVLSYTRVCEYLDMAEKNGLIQYDQLTRNYQATDKGLEYLRKYYDVTSLVYKQGMTVPYFIAGREE